MSFLEHPDEIYLESIDFDWIKSQTKLKNLRFAQKLLKNDGGHYVELDRELQSRIEELDPKEKVRKGGERIDPEDKKKEIESVFEWESQTKKKEQEDKAKRNSKSAKDDDIELSSSHKEKLAESEKNKGNEALKTNDFAEAIQYYTKSIDYWPKMSATYCNRALAYLKTKDYKKVIDDCDKALNLQPGYVKALHRRGKANVALNNYVKAIVDFQEIMLLEPDNNEVNADLKDARSHCSQEDLSKLDSKDQKSSGDDKKEASGGFKRIQIQEDSESEDEEETKKKEENNTASDKNASQSKKMDQMIDNALGGEEKKNLKEKLNKLDEIKSKGQDHLRIGAYDKAINEYEHCLNMLNNLKTSFKTLSDSDFDYTKRKSTYLNNMAFCYMQLGEPNKVIDYSSRVIELKDIDIEVATKAYLRRALSYEKLDKIMLGKRDYEAVKELHPGNVKASEGLNRIHKVLSDSDEKKRYEKEAENSKPTPKAEEEKPKQVPANPEPQPSPVKSVSVNLPDLEKKKEKANELFKNKNYEAAQKEFLKITNEIEKYLNDKKLSKEDQEGLNKLYLAILSNRALALFNVNKFEEAIQDCDKALNLDSKHVKCLFRKGCSNTRLAENVKADYPNLQEIDAEKKQIDYYERARKDIEFLYKIEKNPEIYNKTQELIKVLVTLKLKHKKLGEADKTAETKKEKKPEKEENKQAAKVDSPEKKKETTKTPILPSGMTKEMLDKVTTNVVKNVTDALIQGDELPKTASQFETNCQSFKKNHDKLYLYLKKLPLDHVSNLYKKGEMSADLILNIIKGIKLQGLSDDPNYSLNLLKTISETNKFGINIGFTSKTERKEILSVLEELKNSTKENEIVDKLKEKYVCSNL